jgi:hypothetical protein
LWGEWLFDSPPNFQLRHDQLVSGITDIAIRKYLTPDILAFTGTVPMNEQICALDQNSFFQKTH